MPAEDSCQGEVIIALQKDGWTIIGQQAYIKHRDVGIYIDLEAVKTDRNISIEVKCFSGPYISDDFYVAIGQYLVYKQILSLSKPNSTLYLAIPVQVFHERIGPTYRTIMNEYAVKMIIVDSEAEVISQWIQ